jgi:hypothetical protein
MGDYTPLLERFRPCNGPDTSTLYDTIRMTFRQIYLHLSQRSIAIHRQYVLVDKINRPAQPHLVPHIRSIRGCLHRESRSI